jgi:hypothetical protein
MKLYAIKHKGASIIENFLGCSMERTIGNSFTCYCPEVFFRKSDALKWLDEYPSPDFLEIVSLEVPKSKQDNRKRL